MLEMETLENFKKRKISNSLDKTENKIKTHEQKNS